MGEYSICTGGQWKVCNSADIYLLAMVYSERKRLGKAKCGVYSLLTDCKEFLFYRIDDDGVVHTILLLPSSFCIYLTSFFSSGPISI